jgi:hypothetical protein
MGLLSYYSQCIHVYLSTEQKLEQIENVCFVSYFLHFKFERVIFVRELTDLNRKSLNIREDSNGFEAHLKGMPVSTCSFYISECSPELFKQKLFALFMKENRKPRVEIARGITRMNILYGVKCPLSNDICQYLPPHYVTHWNLVKSLQITFFQEKSFSPWKIYLAITASPIPIPLQDATLKSQIARS